MKITHGSLHPPIVRTEKMSLTSSKRRAKHQNQFPGKTMGFLFLGFSSKSRLDKHQSGIVQMILMNVSQPLRPLHIHQAFHASEFMVAR